MDKKIKDIIENEMDCLITDVDFVIKKEGSLQALVNMLEEAINYTRCSLQLPDVDKRKEIEEEAYTLNLQNLSGREDFEKAFRIGIMTGIDETIEYIESKAIV